jgi:arabinose-5-phosphate isomerase
MSASPVTISSGQLASDAAHIMQQHSVNALLVVDHGQLVGAINMQDLLKAGIV